MLFDDSSKQKYSKQVISIYSKLASKFNSPVKTQCKYYQQSCEMIQSIYNGTFLQHYRIDLSKSKDINIKNNDSLINECKGNWIKTRDIILNSFDNLQLIKDEKYLPYGKKFYEELKLPSYFGGRIGLTWQCPFYYLISKPFEKKAYFQDKDITRIKDKIKSIKFNSILETAETICKNHKFNQRDTFYFWTCIEQMCDWWLLVKNNSSLIYSTLKSTFSFRNLLEDYYEWLKETLINQQGGHFILSPWYFKPGDETDRKLVGYFSTYLLSKVKTNQILKNLPMNICFYYDESSFKNPPKEKIIETVEEEIIF